MSIILDKYLKKLGVKSYEDLNIEEKETFQQWENALSGRTITEHDYRAFLEMELDQAVIRLTEIGLTEEAMVFRKVEVKMIKKIIAFLDMPKMEKAMLEKQIESHVN